MGYIRHNAMVVISGNKDTLEYAHDKAKRLFDALVSEVIFTRLGGYYSFFIAPDGSKEGWKESDDFDELRKSLSDFLDGLAYEDGSNPVQFLDVALSEEYKVTIDRTNARIGEMFD